jgi:hypothetical protein
VFLQTASTETPQTDRWLLLKVFWQTNIALNRHSERLRIPYKIAWTDRQLHPKVFWQTNSSFEIGLTHSCCPLKLLSQTYSSHSKCSDRQTLLSRSVQTDIQLYLEVFWQTDVSHLKRSDRHLPLKYPKHTYSSLYKMFWQTNIAFHRRSERLIAPYKIARTDRQLCSESETAPTRRVQHTRYERYA